MRGRWNFVYPEDVAQVDEVESFLLKRINLCRCYTRVFVTLGGVEGASWRYYGSQGAFRRILSVVHCPGSLQRTRGYSDVAVCLCLVQFLVLANVGTVKVQLEIGGYLGILVLPSLISDLVYVAELLFEAIY